MGHFQISFAHPKFHGLHLAPQNVNPRDVQTSYLSNIVRQSSLTIDHFTFNCTPIEVQKFIDG